MIIKCPECGHQVSEKAPLCPNCGVEIAGKIVHCANCGEVYFLSDRMCPSCHQINGQQAPMQQPVPQQPVNPQVAGPQGVGPQGVGPQGSTAPETPAPKRNYTTLIIAVICAVVLCGCMLFFNYSSRSDNEEKEYELALKSDDPLVLQAYLDNYKDDNPVHYQEIKSRLEQLEQEESDWNNILKADSRDLYRQYVDQHPNSIHCEEAKSKIDSIDWVVASNGDEAAVKRYIADHPDGHHASEAQIMLEQLIKEAAEKAAEAAKDSASSIISKILP